MRGKGPLTLPRCPKEFAPRKGWDPFFPPGLRHFSALAVSTSLSVALRLRPALGSWRSFENWQQRGIREFFDSLLARTPPREQGQKRIYARTARKQSVFSGRISS